jgi:hypothetical protein
VVLAALVGLSASSELFALRRLSEVEFHPVSTAWPMSAELAKKISEVARASLFGMRESRMVVLGLLSMSCMLAFVFILRLWRPFGVPRHIVLRVVSVVLLGCALLRTVDGAQQAVMARRMGAALATEIVKEPPQGMEPEVARSMGPMMPALAVGAYVAWTLLIAGCFAALAQYFRSQRAQKVFTVGDPAGP